MFLNIIHLASFIFLSFSIATNYLTTYDMEGIYILEGKFNLKRKSNLTQAIDHISHYQQSASGNRDIIKKASENGIYSKKDAYIQTRDPNDDKRYSIGSIKILFSKRSTIGTRQYHLFFYHYFFYSSDLIFFFKTCFPLQYRYPPGDGDVSQESRRFDRFVSKSFQGLDREIEFREIEKARIDAENGR